MRYCGEKNTYVDGLFIDECFAAEGIVRNQYRFVNGKFRCGQVKILMALTEIGPVDGGTIVVPGGHKISFIPEELKKLYRDKQIISKGGLGKLRVLSTVAAAERRAGFVHSVS
jgi:hypothetical protein